MFMSRYCHTVCARVCCRRIHFSTVANHYITDSTLDGGQHTLLKNFVNEKLDGVYTIPEITEHAVNKALLALKAGKSTDSDSDSELFIRHCLPSNSTAYIMYN